MMEDEPKPRRCTNKKCLQPEKTERDFSKNKNEPGGLERWCKECHKERHKGNAEARNERRRLWGRENPVQDRETHRRRKYKIEVEEQRRMWAAQSGKCLVCAVELDYRKAHLDHNHATGQVRGFLCEGCNKGIGWIKEDSKRLRRAAAYIKVFQMGHPDPHSLLIELRRIGAY